MFLKQSVVFENKTELVNWGIYKYSRNPIYLGMLLTASGFFFMVPCLITLLATAQTFAILHIQIQLEENFLKTQHGSIFIEYCKEVKRWI